MIVESNQKLQNEEHLMKICMITPRYQKKGNYITEVCSHQDLPKTHHDLKVWLGTQRVTKGLKNNLNNSRTHEEFKDSWRTRRLNKDWNIIHSPSSLPSSGRRHFFLCCFSWNQPINHLFLGHLLHHWYQNFTVNRQLCFCGLRIPIQISISPAWARGQIWAGSWSLEPPWG